MKRTYVKVIVFAILVIIPILLFSMLRNRTGDIKAILKDPARPIPEYGFNGNNTKGPAWSNKAFRDSAASLNFKIIRYPGGTVGDFWDWKKGWFVDNDQTGKMNSNAVVSDNINKFKRLNFSPTGLKELKLLVDATQCDVMFTLNMVTENIDNQLDMLKNAQSMGIPVKWVELGNEYNGKESAGRARFVSTSDYGATCKQWITTIKETFPNAKVGVVGGDRQYDADVRNWNNNVLLQASNADAIVAHIYPKPTFIDNDGINFQQLYNEFNNDYAKQGFNRVKKDIWITEFNVLWSAGKNRKSSNERQNITKYAFTWGQALSVLLMTSAATDMANSPNIILDHNISNTSVFAAIETMHGTLQKLPNGIGFGAWCAASHDKTSLRQISFQQGSGVTNDYEIMGWQFIGGSQNTSLLVNFTPKAVSIDVSALNGGTSYSLLYADKNATITGIKDVHRERKQVENSTLELPPFSIATL